MAASRHHTLPHILNLNAYHTPLSSIFLFLQFLKSDASRRRFLTFSLWIVSIRQHQMCRFANATNPSTTPSTFSFPEHTIISHHRCSSSAASPTRFVHKTYPLRSLTSCISKCARLSVSNRRPWPTSGIAYPSKLPLQLYKLVPFHVCPCGRRARCASRNAL